MRLWKMVKEKSAWMKIFILQFVCAEKVGFADKKGPECPKGSKHVAKVLFVGSIKNQTKKQEIQGRLLEAINI